MLGDWLADHDSRGNQKVDLEPKLSMGSSLLRCHQTGGDRHRTVAAGLLETNDLTTAISGRYRRRHHYLALVGSTAAEK